MLTRVHWTAPAARFDLVAAKDAAARFSPRGLDALGKRVVIMPADERRKCTPEAGPQLIAPAPPVARFDRRPPSGGLKDGGAAPHARASVVLQRGNQVPRMVYRRNCAAGRGLSADDPSGRWSGFPVQVMTSCFAGACWKKRSSPCSCWRNWWTSLETWSSACLNRGCLGSAVGRSRCAVHYLIAPMIAARLRERQSVFVWARSSDRWHRRGGMRALIQGTRRKMFLPQIKRLSGLLLRDGDDMVQKGLGGCCARRQVRCCETVPYLLEIRGRSPRLVLRTACEPCPPRRKRILAA